MTEVNINDNLKLVFESETNRSRFSINSMYEKVLPLLNSLPEISENQRILQERIEDRRFREYIIKSLLRNVFLIELVDDDISTTLMKVRWIIKNSGGKKQEAFNESDPRFCTFIDCLDIYQSLLIELNSQFTNDENVEFVKLFSKNHILPYELPLDYSTITQTNGRFNQVHSRTNLVWCWDDRYKRILKLRSYLLDSSNPYNEFFKMVLEDKIKVKTFLTDRVQTGLHKTDREKRWEAHPESVHFATRKSCLEIECTLLNQMFHFYGFPEVVKNELIRRGLMNAISDDYRCPVTLDLMLFEELKTEIEEHRTHGKSKFQIGHLNPLKRAIEHEIFGHTRQNIGWVTEDGNRIQGSLSLEETRSLLKRIQENYSQYYHT